MTRKYLEELGGAYEPREDPDATDERIKEWETQQKELGFDVRDTWSLDATMLELLYERLRLYQEVASPNIDLTYHHFDLSGIEELPDREKYEKVSQLTCIQLMLLHAERALQNDFDTDERIDDASIVWSIWSIAHTSMWW